MFDPTKDPHYQKIMARAEERQKTRIAEQRAADEDQRARNAEQRAIEADRRAIEADKRAIEADQRAIEAEQRNIRLEEELRAHRKRSERRDRITLVLAFLAFFSSVADIILRIFGII